MTPALYDNLDELAALRPGADFIPRVVLTPNDAIPRPATGAACIVVEHSRTATDSTVLYADDRPEHRNPAHWRQRLGPGSLRLVSHPAGVDDVAGLKTRIGLGTWSHDDEAPDLVRFDAAPRRAKVTVAGVVVDAVLMACPGGVPHYGVADVCWLARVARAARKAETTQGAATGRRSTT